jgi:hypothetical protein
MLAWDLDINFGELSEPKIWINLNIIVEVMTLPNNSKSTMAFIWKNNSNIYKYLAFDSAKYIKLIINDCYLNVFNLFDLALIIKSVWFSN